MAVTQKSPCFYTEKCFDCTIRTPIKEDLPGMYPSSPPSPPLLRMLAPCLVSLAEVDTISIFMHVVEYFSGLKATSLLISNPGSCSLYRLEVAE